MRPLKNKSRRDILKGGAAVGGVSVAPGILAQAAPAPVRIGYTMARTGPWTGGAQVTQEPNYILCAEQQNAAGGLNVKGVKRPIELVSSDDRSDVETVVRTYEKLMSQDKVDLILPPWGSNANFAMAPLANKFGYPLLAPTALSRRLVEMKLPYFFLLLQQPAAMTNALVDMLKANGVKTLAVIYVDDLFGIENYAALKVALSGSGIQLVEDKSYPGGIKDLSPVLRSIKDKNVDAFVGFTYPPDTILASRQAKEVGLNPKVFFASVGTAFPLYKTVITAAGAEGVTGMGSWNSKTSPGAKDYFDAHVKKFNKEPDR
jgi:branched-chain amino acid transport system substrate-binding protein